jgi:hypothetical protein
MYSDRRTFYPLSDSVKQANDVVRVLELPRGHQAADLTDVYLPLSENFRDFPVNGLWRDYAAVVSHRVELSMPPHDPLYLYFVAPGDALGYTGTSTRVWDTTPAPEELVVEGALSMLQLKGRLRSTARNHAAVYQRLLQQAGLDDTDIKAPFRPSRTTVVGR